MKDAFSPGCAEVLFFLGPLTVADVVTALVLLTNWIFCCPRDGSRKS